MALFEVSTADYEILASILKDGVGMRRPFTFKELRDTLENVGFSPELKGQMSYDGKRLFVFKRRDKSCAVVSHARQDNLKRQMQEVYGWTKGTFVERSGV